MVEHTNLVAPKSLDPLKTGEADSIWQRKPDLRMGVEKRHASCRGQTVFVQQSRALLPGQAAARFHIFAHSTMLDSVRARRCQSGVLIAGSQPLPQPLGGEMHYAYAGIHDAAELCSANT